MLINFVEMNKVNNSDRKSDMSSIVPAFENIQCLSKYSASGSKGIVDSFLQLPKLLFLSCVKETLSMESKLFLGCLQLALEC